MSPVFADTPFDPGALDPHEAERKRAARDARLNTVEIPRLRLLGFTFVAVGMIGHRARSIRSKPSPYA